MDTYKHIILYERDIFHSKKYKNNKSMSTFNWQIELVTIDNRFKISRKPPYKIDRNRREGQIWTIVASIQK